MSNLKFFVALGVCYALLLVFNAAFILFFFLIAPAYGVGALALCAFWAARCLFAAIRDEKREQETRGNQ